MGSVAFDFGSMETVVRQFEHSREQSLIIVSEIGTDQNGDCQDMWYNYAEAKELIAQLSQRIAEFDIECAKRGVSVPD